MKSRFLEYRKAHLPILILLVFLPSAVRGQFMGSISGTVLDEAGAVVPGAIVTVRGPTLQRRKLTTLTNREGKFRFAAIPAGSHRVEAAMAGFAPPLPQNARVAVNQEIRVDFILQVKPPDEKVEVMSSIPPVETTRASINSRVLTEAIDALPLNGRNFTDLLGLVPGAKPTPEGSQGTEISIFGERGAAISYIIDGGDNNDPLNGGAFQLFTQDSVREFEVITTGYEAEFGRAQGGVVNIITRPGTNEWVGTGFLFLRNDSLDSSNVTDQEVPQLDRQQWGGIGWPHPPRPGLLLRLFREAR